MGGNGINPADLRCQENGLSWFSTPMIPQYHNHPIQGAIYEQRKPQHHFTHFHWY